MLIARALQLIGAAALAGAALLAFDARIDVPSRPSPSNFCQALRLADEVARLNRQPTSPLPAECTLPPGKTWSTQGLAVAAQAAMGALLLIGLGAGLGDLRRIRERVEKQDHD